MTTCAQILNTIGLSFGMVGVIIIFIFGPPQPNLEEGVRMVVEDGTRLQDGRTASSLSDLAKNRR